MSNKRWRIIENEYNRSSAPWGGTMGIEEADEEAAVPAVILWFTRGWEDIDSMARSVVDAHNKALK